MTFLDALRSKIGFGDRGTFTPVSASNPLPVSSSGGLISTNNSSVATLAGDAVFTGTSDDVTHYASVSVSWNSDVASADSGMSMQFSTDGTNWDRMIPVTSESNALQANHGGVHRLAVIAQYFRVVYTNGSTIQADFRLQTIYHTDNALPLVSRVSQQLSTSTDCALVRPVTDIKLDIARKHITGQEAYFFFGFNADVDTAWEDIHANGGDMPWPVAAAKIAISSTHAADTAAGLGCQSVEVHGLSATGADQYEVIATNGTTEVESTLDYVRVNLAHAEEVGTYGGANQGDISVRVTSAGAKTGDILSKITGVEGAVDSSVQYGSGEAGNGFVSVPLGKVLYISKIHVIPNVKSTQTIDVALYEREGILTVADPFLPRRLLWQALEINEQQKHDFRAHIKIKSLTDVFFRAKGSGTNNKIEVSLDGYLVDEDSEGA
ncbi:MAG: hypothetical protein ACI88C_000035 [Acidimicrobiales bacterium]|jgi:hypothetical protein